MKLLEVDNLSVMHGKKSALAGFSFEASRGEIIGFIGSDGSGKSSALNALAGVQRFGGTIHYDSHAIHSAKDAEIIKRELGFMPQGIGLVLYETLTVSEHLDFFSDIREIKKDEAHFAYRTHLLHMAGLENFLLRRANELSGGMMQKLSLICAMLHRPSLLILDEPTTGVDPLSRLELWKMLRQNAKESDTLTIISTAYLQEAQMMDRVFLFEHGKMKHELSHADGSLDLFIDSHAKKSTNLFEHLPKSEKRMLEAKGITKRFGDFTAAQMIDIELKSGEILGLLGANGAGKTTLIKMLLGLLSIDEGELYLLGKRIQNANDRIELKSKIGYVSQHFALYKDMSLLENMLFFASMHGIEQDEAHRRIDEYALKLGFSDYLGEMPTDLPLGINQRFSLATAILHKPLILFLDEPTSGVDPEAREEFWRLLQELKNTQEIAILITTHYMSEAEYCDRVVLLKEGKKVADESVAHLYERFSHAKSFEEIFLEFYK